MSEQGEFVNNSAAQAAGPDISVGSDRGVGLGVAAVVGGASTLAAAVSLKDLFQNNPFFALAVFAVLASFLIFVVAVMGRIPASWKWPVAAFTIALLFIGVAAGLVAMLKGPPRVEIVVTAMPAINDAKPVRFVGSKEYVVGWNGQTRVLAGGPLTLDLTGVRDYYTQQQKSAENDAWSHCMTLADKKYEIGPGAPRTTSGRSSS